MLLSLVILCFTLSGFAALLYQTAWMRLFSIAFGTSEIAVAIVLAGYMAGLAIGAAIAAHFVDRIRRPVLVYGVLEGAIALAALALPFFVALTGEIYASLVGHQPTPPNAEMFGQPLFYSIAALLVLLVPTALMGATLPLLARYVVTTNRNLGSRISALYSMNTIGAVGGALFAGFVLLPALGLRGTVWIGVAVNGIVFMLAALLARYTGDIPAASRSRNMSTRSPAAVKFILPLIAFSGLLSFIYEVLWTRMLSHVLGSSIYAFATMLAAFLTGIALGAAGAGIVAKSPRQASYLFAFCQFGIAIASAFVYWRLQHSLLAESNHALLAFAVILPSTLFIGATYPLAVRVFAGDVQDAGRASAIVYSWNTVGAIIGAIAGGFYIIPRLGFAGTAQMTVIANLGIGIAAIAWSWRVPGWQRLHRGIPVVAAIVATGLGVSFNPGRPDAIVTEPIFGGSGVEILQEHYYAVGRSSTVYLTENAARFDLSTNGLPEAQIEFDGAPPYILSQRWLGMWPSFARPDTESILVVGLGGGVVLEGVPQSVKSVHTIELEQEVVNANAVIGDRRGFDPLRDPRIEIIINDARNALRLTSHRYDAIVSQPSHPWTAGASHLFTREFFALAKSRLTDDGVFVQWMNAEFLNEELLRRLTATLLAEFEYVRIYQPTALALHFIASNQELVIESSLATTGRPLVDDPAHFARNGINGPADIIATLSVDDVGARLLAAGYDPITDDDNRMAIDTNSRAEGLGIDLLSRILSDYDPLLKPNSWLRQVLSDEDLAFIAWRLTQQGQTPRVERLIETIRSHPTQQLMRAMLLRYRGRSDEANAVLASIGPTTTVYEEVLFLKVEESLPWIASGEMTVDELPVVESEEGRLGVFIGAWQALGKRDWPALLSYENRLRNTRMSDLWAPYVAQLRAEWRLRADDSDGRLAREALHFVDQSVATQATLDGYTQRARAGLKLNDGPVFIESVAYVLQMIQQRMWEIEYAGSELSDMEYQSVILRLDEFATQLERFMIPDQSGRARRVSLQLQKVRASVQR